LEETFPKKDGNPRKIFSQKNIPYGVSVSEKVCSERAQVVVKDSSGRGMHLISQRDIFKSEAY
jgi:hypothetical protein